MGTAETSKTKNAIKNISIGIFSQIISLFFTFFCRTLFIEYLGKEFLGINGLFTNILSLLSLAELGFGTAITFDMYSAIKEDNKGKIIALSKLYKKIYIFVGLFIVSAGLIITPFIPYMISNNVNVDVNIYIVFMMFVINTSTTYFFSYRTSVISAFQYRRIVDIGLLLGGIVRDLLSILLLYFTKNYYFYLMIQIIVNTAIYVILHCISNKIFPFLSVNNDYVLTNDEKNRIFKNVTALMIYKIASVILSSTDNIIISTMVDTLAVGVLSNYTMIINALKNILIKVINGYMASLGIASSKEDSNKIYTYFKYLRIVIYWIYGFVSIGILLMINEVIEFWIGKDYLFTTYIVIALVLYFWLEGIGNLSYSFRTTLGLFRESKFAPIIASILNILLSIVFAYFWGVFGVLIATPICRLLTYFWIDPVLIYKKRFNKSFCEYFRYFFVYFIVTIISLVANYYFIKLVTINGFWGIFLKILSITIISNLIYLLYFFTQNEFKNLIKNVFQILKRR